MGCVVSDTPAGPERVQVAVDVDGLVEVIRDHHSFVLSGHVNPDGDCLGSITALAAALRAAGKQATCVFANGRPDDPALEGIPGFDEIVPAEDFDGEVEVFVACDVPVATRLGESTRLQRRAKVALTIDHHPCEVPMSDYALIDADAPATCEIVWRVARALGVEPTPALSSSAYTGLLTDTGGFRYQNTHASAFAAASQMCEGGAEVSKIAERMFMNKSLAHFKLLGALVERAQVDLDRGFAIGTLDAATLESCGATADDTEGLIDRMREVRGVRACAMLRQTGPGTVRGSLRSKGSVDVAGVAASFDGGGHRAAAGFNFFGTVEEAAAALEPRLVAAIEEADAAETLAAAGSASVDAAEAADAAEVARG